MTEIITITPKADCKACKGFGMLPGDRVPYGSTTAQLPDDYCDCVLEQIPEDDGNSDVELKLSDETIAKQEAEAKAEREYFERMAAAYIDSIDNEPRNRF